VLKVLRIELAQGRPSEVCLVVPVPGLFAGGHFAGFCVGESLLQRRHVRGFRQAGVVAVASAAGSAGRAYSGLAWRRYWYTVSRLMP
jgi:hypothetical protein